MPVTSPKIHAICLRRACASRTWSPLSPACRIAGPGWKTLNIASCEGVFVIALSLRQLVRSSTPVPFRRRLTWKPCTASLVVAS